MTRPKPTIYGNCDSWDFIVGKKPRTYSPRTGTRESLQRCNMEFIHKLSTSLEREILDNLWAICGSPVDCHNSSRIVDSGNFNMPVIRFGQVRFYPILLLAPKLS
jgi:hypothetical protein